MRIDRTSEYVNYIEPLKEGSVHVVAFAEEGLSNFRALAELSLRLPITKTVRLCDDINSKDETGTLGPKGNLTALPKRFFRDEDFDKEGFSRCLRDAFIANRDHCKSNHLVFQFSCVQLHLDNLFEEVKKMAEQEFSDSGIEQITVHLDG
ncbi:MAG: hypothetical protein IPM59_03425 [Chloracidobacterium sp.]|nr:hypothetical protein [Chloracidobacterium sp.]